MDKGFLTDTIHAKAPFDVTHFRSTIPRFTPENRKINTVLVDLLPSNHHPMALTRLLAQKA
ncbi:hypothetical protein BWI97_20790 [Siphonobacter sp. BAB-5405]|nr:hypothetical protein [Siphonobacter sp. BAB-5405]PMD92522.1 hypothetical protein BWI97_20790 [Siphonobacter sp. BAB-5405]